MKVFAKTRKSHYWNEDRFIIGKDFYIVIDGATPLKKIGDFNLACWMVKYIKKHINKYDGSIKSRLIKLSLDAYQELGIDSSDKALLPSAGMSWVEEDKDYYNVGILGDCEVTFRTIDGKIIRCFSDEITKLDNVALKQMISVAKEKNIHLIEARKYIQDVLIKHRSLLNEPNGYNAFTISKNFELNEKSFKIKKDLVSEIYLYSDGFSQAFQHLDIYKNHEEMFTKSFDVNEEISKIVSQSFSDPYCDKYPRFKKIDDITVIKIIK